MSYVGIPNHVLHGDETTFPMFHRSHIEHSGKGKPLKKTLTRKNPVPKSTISKIPTTNKENTQTTITDQTQKKTLRSMIHQHKLRKRQLFGSHSLFGSVSPINNIGDSHKSVEQKNKLSTIPRHTSNRKKTLQRGSSFYLNLLRVCYVTRCHLCMIFCRWQPCKTKLYENLRTFRN